MAVVSTGMASTRSPWRAAYFLVRGLRLVRARRQGRGHVTFLFADPDGGAPQLVREFEEDAGLQRLIDSRVAILRP